MSTDKQNSQQEAYNGHGGKPGKSKGENGSFILNCVRMGDGDHAMKNAFEIEAFVPTN